MNKQHFDTKKMYYGSPVLMISYYDPKGIPNVATMSSSFSLDNMIALGFGKNGHAVNSILETREFVINIPDRTMMEQIEICGFFSGHDYQKFDLAKLTLVPSDVVNSPIIRESPIALECMVDEVFEMPSNPDLIFVIASIIGRKVAARLMTEDGTLNSTALDPVLFVGDSKQRIYRTLEQGRYGVLGEFLPSQLKT